MSDEQTRDHDKAPEGLFPRPTAVIDGAVVHGAAPPTPEAEEALRAVIAAARKRMESEEKDG